MTFNGKVELPETKPLLWIHIPVKSLVRGTLVGLSGLEPLTSALSGPARTPENDHSEAPPLLRRSTLTSVQLEVRRTNRH